MRLRAVLIAALAAAGAGPAIALPVELQDRVEIAEPAGCSDFSYLFWDLYRAELWSEAAQLPGDEFGLSLTYKSDFSRDQLVDSSISEMARISGRKEQSFAAARHDLERSFRDVAPGDRFTAWRSGPDRVAFYFNGRETGTLSHDADLFLSIWLGEKARDSKGRQALLSGRCDA